VPLAERQPRIAGRYPAVVSDSFFEPLPAEELQTWE
jgi:hypothetical protein